MAPVPEARHGSMNDAPKNSDLHCFRCGYSLAGIQSDTVCPECGLAIARSIEAAHPMAPRRIVRTLRTIAALDVAVFVLPIAIAFFVYSGFGGAPRGPGVGLTVLALSPIVRSAMLLYLLWITARSWANRGDRAKLVAVSVVCGRIATTVWLIAAELFQQFSISSPSALIACVFFAACEAMTRRVWLRRVSRAFGGPTSEHVRYLTRIASLASWPLNIAATFVLLALWDGSVEFLVFLPIVIVAHLVHAFCLGAATFACAETVPEWHAARVEP